LEVRRQCPTMTQSGHSCHLQIRERLLWRSRPRPPLRHEAEGVVRTRRTLARTCLEAVKDPRRLSKLQRFLDEPLWRTTPASMVFILTRCLARPETWLSKVSGYRSVLMAKHHDRDDYHSTWAAMLTIPDDYRAKASECAELAAKTKDPQSKRVLEKTAEQWNALADDVEKRPGCVRVVHRAEPIDMLTPR
jgi:hypothetical protein